MPSKPTLVFILHELDGRIEVALSTSSNPLGHGLVRCTARADLRLGRRSARKKATMTLENASGSES